MQRSSDPRPRIGTRIAGFQKWSARWLQMFSRVFVPDAPDESHDPPNSSYTLAHYQQLIEDVQVARYPPVPIEPKFERLCTDESQIVLKLARLAVTAVIENYRNGKVSGLGAKALRDQHAKQHGCVRATFVVRHDLPPELRVGVFQPGAKYDATIRFSNAAGAVHADRRPDGRGMAIKLHGVEGDKLLDEALEPLDRLKPMASTQDFLFSDYPVFFGKNVRDYARVMHLVQTPCANGRERLAQALQFVAFLLCRPHQTSVFIGHALQRRTNPLLTTYHSMSAYLYGEDRVVRYVVTPVLGQNGSVQTTKAPIKQTSPDFLRDAMQLTLHPDGDETPIGAIFDFAILLRAAPSVDDVEDTSKAWVAPNDAQISLARIEIPLQLFATADRDCDCENMMFNPWNTLAEHQPLGGLNRMRLALYIASTRVRHRLNMIAEPQIPARQ
jgi:hypothetical protein